MSQPMDENRFKRSIYGKYREHFDHIHRLHPFAEEALLNYRGITVDAYHRALQLILPRALKSFDSARRLCEVAYCEDAAVVLRSLLNLMAVTRWISLDPQKRGKKYLAWYWIQMHRDAERFKDSIPRAWVADIQKHYKAVKPQFEYKDTKGHTRLAKQWYQPEAKTIRDLFEQVDLKRQYEEGYMPLSGIEHSDATAFFAMVAAADKSGGEMRLEVQSDLFVPHYLRNAFQYFADIFRICNQTLHIADAEKFDEIVAAGIKFYKADMQAKGIPP